MKELAIYPNSLLSQAEKIFDSLDVSESTRHDYKKSIRCFFNFIPSSNLDNNTLLSFKRYLKEKTDIGISSKNKYLITARIFLKELARQQLIPDITHNIKCFNQGRKHKKDGLSESEISSLCNYTQSLPPTRENLRLKALLSLLIFQGLRQKEIAQLNIEHINFQNAKAQITGKGQDDFEIISLHPQTLSSILPYIANRKSGALFTQLHSNSRLSTKSIRRIITSTLLQLNINKSTHGFRHFFTSALIPAFNGNLLAVSQLTRHKSLDMLQVYYDENISSNNLPQYHSAFSNILL